VHYLKKAVASCFEENGAVDVEVVVVNDGSSDGTRSYLDETDNPRIRPIHQSSQGPQAARNAGLDAASGRYIKFLDDDDWLTPGSLVAEVRHLDATDADVAHGRLRVLEENEGTHLAPESLAKDAAATVLRDGMWTVPHKYLFRRTSIQEHTWDPSLPYHQDYAFVVDVSCRGLAFTALDRVVGVRRIHEGPRIADTKTAASRTDYYTLKVDLIMRGVRLLQEHGLLREHHRRAAAEGIWTWAHIVAGYNLNAFKTFYAHIQEIDPGFMPERHRPGLGTLDVWLGVEETERLLYPFRRLKNTLS
jgi:glycosyltransferase involved in cell wall biosynthesis